LDGVEGGTVVQLVVAFIGSIRLQKGRDTTVGWPKAPICDTETSYPSIVFFERKTSQ
jgi:hypothetical protein